LVDVFFFVVSVVVGVGVVICLFHLVVVVVIQPLKNTTLGFHLVSGVFVTSFFN